MKKTQHRDLKNLVIIFQKYSQKTVKISGGETSLPWILTLETTTHLPETMYIGIETL